jgi:hypothetical protein
MNTVFTDVVTSGSVGAAYAMIAYGAVKCSSVLPTIQVQVLRWTGDSGSNPERAHGDKFLVC